MHFKFWENSAKLPCKEVARIYTPTTQWHRGVCFLKTSWIFHGNTLTNAGPGAVFLQYLWYWVSALPKCWYSENKNSQDWLENVSSNCEFSCFFNFFFFLLQICGTVRSLANLVSYATRGLLKTGATEKASSCFSISRPQLSTQARAPCVVSSLPLLSRGTSSYCGL